MSAGNHEEQEAAIIRKVYGHGYSHAESIMHRLAHYQQQMPHREAVTRLHDELMDE